MKEVIDFFRRLHDDNTREWFDAHRAEWTRVKGRFADFTGQLIGGIASFDPEVRGLRPQDCTYRIARDTRFSPDKSPYKTYIGAYIAPKGKKSGFAPPFNACNCARQAASSFRRCILLVVIFNCSISILFTSRILASPEVSRSRYSLTNSSAAACLSFPNRIQRFK